VKQGVNNKVVFYSKLFQRRHTKNQKKNTTFELKDVVAIRSDTYLGHTR